MAFLACSRPVVTVWRRVIIGASSQQQLDENLAAIEVALTSAELQVLDTLTRAPERYPNWMMTEFPDKELMTYEASMSMTACQNGWMSARPPHHLASRRQAEPCLRLR